MAHCSTPAASLKSTEEGKFVLTLGGDHSLATGTLAGAISARPDVGVLWIDAHADINTPEVGGK